MAKYRKKPVVIEEVQWSKDGDHPAVEMFPTPQIMNPEHQDICKKCGRYILAHGLVDTLEGWHLVCPSDLIITGVSGDIR